MALWVLLAAAAGFLAGWLMLDSIVSGVILGAALGAVMLVSERRRNRRQT